MNNQVAQRIFFGVLLLAVTAAFVWLIRGFLQPIFWAVAIGIVFFPMHEWVVRKLKGRRAIAAGISVVLIVIIVVLPLTAIVTAMAGEAAGLYERVTCNTQAQTCDKIDVAAAIDWGRQAIPAPVLEFIESLGFDFSRLRSQLSSMAVTASQFVATQAISIGQNTIRITVYFFLMLYLLFFFMRDGTKILEGLVRALPFGDERERHLLGRFAEVSRATIKGTLVVGVVQGAMGGIMFALLGIGAPVLWGVVMALLSIIPAVGPALVWIPAAIILLVQGHIVSAIALTIAGSLLIGLADNLLRPLLVGRDTKMPDYLILLSTLGGLTAFGLAGVVIGPIIASFFLSIWEMAEEEYADTPDALGSSPTGGGSESAGGEDA